MITMMKKKIISKALMNRFISIYVDEININEQFQNIISITGNKLKEKMNENFVKLNDYP